LAGFVWLLGLLRKDMFVARLRRLGVR